MANTDNEVVLSYNEAINTPAGRIKGCAYCEHKFTCPEAFSDIASKCGAFNTELMTTVFRPKRS